MKKLQKSENNREVEAPDASIERGQAAAKLMAKNLRKEHKRWGLPLLGWKDGKLLAVKP